MSKPITKLGRDYGGLQYDRREARHQVECPLCGIPLFISEMGVRSHVRAKHKGLNPEEKIEVYKRLMPKAFERLGKACTTEENNHTR